MADLLKLADDYTAAWSVQDREKAESFLADDAVFTDVLGGGDPVVGRAAVRKEVIDGFMDACPDCAWKRIADRNPVVGADSVGFEWTFSGTNTGEWSDGTPASGKPFNIHGMTILHFNEAGKITGYTDYIDYMTLSKQMGWIEE